MSSGLALWMTRGLGTLTLLAAFASAAGCASASATERVLPAAPRATAEAASVARAAAEAPTPEVRQDGEAIVVVEGDREQILVEEAQGFLASLAPDGQWLALDVRLLSDVQVTYLYHQEADGDWNFERNLSRPAWETARTTLDLGPDLDDLLRARTRFLRWSEDGRTCSVEVSGELDGRELELEVELELDGEAGDG